MATEAFLFKCIQIYEVHLGAPPRLHAVGPAGGAKTSAKNDARLAAMAATSPKVDAADGDGNAKYSTAVRTT